MAFRDEREALRLRVENLERELREARGELGVPAAASVPKRRWGRVLFASLAATAAVAFTAARASRPCGSARPVAPSARAHQAPSARTEPTEVSVVGPGTEMHFFARFEGGAPGPRGCHVTLRTRPDERGPRVESLGVECGTTLAYAYRERDASEHPVYLRDLAQQPGPRAGSWIYQGSAEGVFDTGESFELRTQQHRLTVRARGTGRGADLFVEPWTLPVFGPALRPEARVAGRPGAPVRLRVQVSATRGPAPVGERERCELAVYPGVNSLNQCQAIVRCGERVLYGSPEVGVADCTTNAAGVIASFTDEATSAQDFDPRLRWSGGAIELADAGPRPWSVRFTTPAPRPAFEGRFERRGSTSWSVVLPEGDRPTTATVSLPGLRGDVVAVRDLVADRVALGAPFASGDAVGDDAWALGLLHPDGAALAVSDRGPWVVLTRVEP